ANRMKNSCFFHNGKFYVYNPNNVTYFVRTDKIEDYILTACSRLIDYSKIMHKDDILLAATKKTKEYIKLSTLATIKTFLPHLKIGLERDGIIVDNTPQQQHFNNGYYDQTLNIFKPREFGVDFITKYIKRDYVPSTPQ